MKSITSRALIGIILLSFLTVPIIQAKPQIDDQTRIELLESRSQKAKLEAEERLLKMKSALQLRDDQLAAWSEYEKHILSEQSERHVMMKNMQQRRLSNLTPPNSVELAQKNVERLERQLDNAKQRLVVFTDLYNVLDETQRQTIDKLTSRKIKQRAKKLRKKMRDQ